MLATTERRDVQQACLELLHKRKTKQKSNCNILQTVHNTVL